MRSTEPTHRRCWGDLLYALETVEAGRGSGRTPCDTADVEDRDVDVVFARLQLERQSPDSSRTYRQRLCVPDNLLILGTMNTTRSIGRPDDLALRRRFVFQLEPLTVQELLGALHDPRFASDLEDWAQLNERLAAISPDALLGHSYFFDFKAAQGRSVDPEQLHLWRDLLLPQVAEILVAFNAVDRLEDVLGAINAGGWTLARVGTGIDAYPIPTPKAEAPAFLGDVVES